MHFLRAQARRRYSTTLIAGVCCILFVLVSAAAQPPSAPPAAAEVVLQNTLAEIVRAALADSLTGAYEHNEDWGKTKKVTTGFKIKGQGLDLRLERRRREVKHGRWQKYSVAVIDPQHNLQVSVENLRPAGPGKVAMQIFVTAVLHGDSRYERWRQGVKLLNFSTEADVTLQMRADCEVALKLVPGKLLRDLVIEPRVTGVGVELLYLDVQRISKIGGDAAHEIGDSLKPMIAKELHRREAKVVEQLNRGIAKKQDRLRFSPDELLSSRWSKISAVAGAVNQAQTAAQK